MKRFATLLLIILLVGCSDSTDRDVWKLSGESMGTTWHITIVDAPQSVEQQKVVAQIERDLAEIILQMSTWERDSELSRFNLAESTDWQTVSPQLVYVVKLAQQISKETAGAFDITVSPLVDLWGFGAGAKSDTGAPDRSRIKAVMKQTGYQHLEVRESPAALKKSLSDLNVDLSAIAKGYAVDVVSESLSRFGIRNRMVEIGGEVRVAGSNASGNPWRIAIEKPDSSGAAKRGLSLSSLSVATSGDYRNYFDKDGERYSHIIDPRSGYPVNHKLASVTVIAEECAVADAWATALMVLGESKGMEIAEKSGIAALFIYRSGEKFLTVSTNHMQKHLYK